MALFLIMFLCYIYLFVSSLFHYNRNSLSFLLPLHQTMFERNKFFDFAFLKLLPSMMRDHCVQCRHRTIFSYFLFCSSLFKTFSYSVLFFFCYIGAVKYPTHAAPGMTARRLSVIQIS